MKTLKLYKSKIPSDIKIVCDTTNEIIEFFQNNIGFMTECNLFEFKVILNELIINAIKHGNKSNPHKLVSIDVGICPEDFVYMIIEDQGEGYDYKNTEPQNSNDICQDDYLLGLKETGRGILIVKNLCESVKFNKKGNKVVILKKINTC